MGILVPNSQVNPLPSSVSDETIVAAFNCASTVRLILQCEQLDIQTCLVAVPKLDGWISLTKLLELVGILPEMLWPAFSPNSQTGDLAPKGGFGSFPAIRLEDERMCALANILNKVIRVVVHETGGYLHVLTASPRGTISRYQP